MARLLVFDFDPLFRDIVQATLERAGHTAVAVDSAAACIRLLAVATFDVVIADLSAELGDAPERLAAMRALGLAPAVVGVAGAGPAAPSWSRAGCFAAVVAKPFIADDLLAAVNLALKDKGGTTR